MMSSLQGEPKACVIGYPVRHSRSPLIHGYWLNQLGIKGSYERAEVAPGEFSSFMENFVRLGFTGANVTLPHKQASFERCARTTATAACLKAVNTLWIEAGKLHGDNTDAVGFLAALDEDAPAWGHGRGHAVILGAGGAARAVAYALKLRGMKKIMLINRTKTRADAIASDIGPPVETGEICDIPRLLAGAALLVNTTSLGMLGQPPLDIGLGPLPRDAAVSDIVYVPAETELIRAAKARGLRTVPGIGMLLHQAVPGFERWFGVRPAVTAELRSLIEADILASL
jgi:shikimate dehydrogenase